MLVQGAITSKFIDKKPYDLDAVTHQHYQILVLCTAQNFNLTEL